MTAVVLGAGGMLGRALSRELPGATTYTHASLDITDEESVRGALTPGVDVVFNAAAFTKVDACETDDIHLRVNAVAVRMLAERCREIGAKLVHVSTDYVFDGKGTRPYREDDPVDPVNAYGAGKLLGERYALESGAEVLVVRTSWVYGVGGVNFVDTILKQVEAGRHALRVVADQRGRPTYAPDLARALRVLAGRGASGLVHFANQEETTWHALASAALALAGYGTVPVAPCSTAEFLRPAARPAYSVLDTARYLELTGERPRSWREAVADYVAERAA